MCDVLCDVVWFACACVCLMGVLYVMHGLMLYGLFFVFFCPPCLCVLALFRCLCTASVVCCVMLYGVLFVYLLWMCAFVD